MLICLLQYLIRCQISQVSLIIFKPDPQPVRSDGRCNPIDLKIGWVTTALQLD